MSDASRYNTNANDTYDAPLGEEMPGRNSDQGQSEGNAPAARARPNAETGQLPDATHDDEIMRRVRELNLKPFGDNPPPDTLTPTMLVPAPALQHKYPDVFSAEEFARGRNTYARRRGMDRATVPGELCCGATAPEQPGRSNRAATRGRRSRAPTPTSRVPRLRLVFQLCWPAEEV